MTVRENMAFALKLAKKTKAEIDAAITKAATALQLTDYLDRLPKALAPARRHWPLHRARPQSLPL